MPWQVLHSTLTGRPSTIAWIVCASVIWHRVQKLSTSPPTLSIGRGSIANPPVTRTVPASGRREVNVAAARYAGRLGS